MRNIIALIFLLSFVIAGLARADAGDSLDGALRIEFGREYTDNLASREDIDYYRFDLPANGNVVIAMQHDDTSLTSSGAFWIGELSKLGSNSVLHSIDLAGAPNSAFIQEGLPAGAYQIKVIRHNYSPAQYHLKVDFQPSEFMVML